MIYTPKVLLDRIEKEKSKIGVKAFMIERKSNRLRESWCAALFGLIFEQRISKCQIDISEEDEQAEYDFKFHAFDEIHLFQLVELLDAERKRSLEYRYPHETEQLETDGIVSSVYAPQLIKQAVEKKINKNYADPYSLNLLLYANFDGVNAGWANILKALSEYSTSFASLWIMTGNAICCVHGGIALYGPFSAQ